ncbi:uncharacterized protein JCM15063_000574 [Sporobolomyces koalae]|uniref:uncharacterized protein n=1 Tax=Sporobolomyces koalae TaxID=500713 RepID=UPI00317EB3E4
MAPATTANGKPKRKRQRRRRQQQSDSSSSGSSSSSSDSDSSSEDEQPVQPVKAPSPAVAASSSSDDSSSSSDSSSSDSDMSDLDMAGGRRRGRGRRGRAQQQQSEGQSAATAAGGASATTSAAELRRPYPSRSPSPQRIDPAHVPLGSSLFPLLQPATDGQPILQGQVPGDVGFAGETRTEEENVAEPPIVSETVQREREREQRFGEWWRARLVSEFEGDLGGLAAEPGLNPSRLQLLLSSLTTLSSLHTTSSTAAAEARSIWLHNPAAPIDPLSAVAATDDAEGAEEWGKTPIGGQGDVEVGEEGVAMDEKKSKKGKSRRKSKGKTDAAAMDVDE